LQKIERSRCCDRKQLEEEAHCKETRFLNVATKGDLKRKLIAQ
jgi:hypothetical protein